MNKSYKIFTGLLVLMGVVSVLGACQQKNQEKSKPATNVASPKDQGIKYYTCPMHPQIRETAPGKCPICEMTLVPVATDASGNSSSMKGMNHILTLTPQEQFLAGITVDTARGGTLRGEIQLTGTTVFDPEGEETITSWVDGWILKSFVRNPGEMIQVGDPLYELYSPDLLSAQRDYVLAMHQDSLFRSAKVNLDGTLQAMKQKLIRWGLSSAQIEALPKAVPDGKVFVYSKAKGFVVQILKQEGDRVKEGDPVVSIAKNSTIWVQAQLYDNELPLVKNDPPLWVEVDGFSGPRIRGAIVFNNPVNENDSRVHQVNIKIANPTGKIQPGMLAYVFLESKSKSGGTIIPASSIIYGATMDYAWVQKSPNKFERRMVRLGKSDHNKMEILSGINSGDLVVSGGAYLLNSEYILEFGSGMNMGGVQMSDMDMSGMSH